MINKPVRWVDLHWISDLGAPTGVTQRGGLDIQYIRYLHLSRYLSRVLVM